MSSPKRKFDPKDIPRTYMSPSYFEEREPGTFEMFRDILIETDEVDAAGVHLREKFGKRIGPMYRCRQAQRGEKEDFITSRPDGAIIRLVKVV